MKDPVSASTLIPDCAEIKTLEAFDQLVAGSHLHSESEHAVLIQGLDLLDRARELEARQWQRTVFLGCRMSPGSQCHVGNTGGTAFPAFHGLPYNPYRGRLYTPQELRADDLDTAIYRHQERWRKNPPAPILEALAQRIHDHAIDDALHAYLEQHDKVVAIMGGHSLHRDEPTYAKVAHIARALTRAGYLVVTGGGPGAMEAGNLGAWLAPQPDEALDTAIDLLKKAVDYSTQDYLDASQEVVAAFPTGASSLAIPTWFYGHEPTNDFATDVAKYFSNSIREDGLLAIATHGVVYTPGAAGTVQEVFMDATQNHYNVFRIISPMVFVDTEYWADDRLGAPKLLRQLAGDRPYSKMIAVLDDPDDVVAFIKAHPPIR